MKDRWITQEWTTGDLNALVKNLGEETAREVQRGEVRIRLEEVVKTLFDKNGRRIPEGLRANVCDPNRDFRLNQPRLVEVNHYLNRVTRFHSKLGIDTGITAEQLQQETERLLAMIRGNSQIANIANSVWLPIVLPKLEVDDLGVALEQYFKAGGESYIDVFPDRKFYNYREGELVNQVSVAEGSRHDQLIDRLKQEPVIGIHFPNPLQGFSINADREQMATLPEGFVLSGLDTIIAMVMYPDVLARNWNTPGLDLAAYSWQSAGSSLYFRAYGGRLVFSRTDYLTRACDFYSGGLFFLG